MRRGPWLAALVAVMTTGAVGAEARPRTTETQTIVDSDGDNRLEPGPGDDYVLRDDLGVKTSLAGRSHLAFFAQLTDTHVIDEESPLRVEFLDRFGSIFTSAYRPHEGLSAQVLNEMVEQVRNTTSPITGERLELVMTTGDNTDNTQCNETRWMIDLMDGGVTVNPDSGLTAEHDFTRSELCLTEDSPPLENPPACDYEPDGRLYHGVRGGGEYYEPDSSRPEPGADEEDGPGYSPDRAENQREAGRDSSVRDFPDLYEAMNRPFRSVGFDDIPWYGIFGNHDGLIQGNQPRNPAFEALGVSCVKVTGLSQEGEEDFENAGSKPAAMAEVLADMTAPAADTPATTVIPPDPRRRPLRKQEYIAEHFKTNGTPVGHGFGPHNLATGEGHYSFNPKPGLRFIVLDSVAEGGLEHGNIDDDQFRWLHAQLLEAEAKAQKELVVVFAHHSLQTMGQPPVSPFPYGDTGGNLSPLVHYGLGPRETRTDLPCAAQDPASPPLPDETLKCLLLRHRSVIAFVNGHEHSNRVTPFPRRPGTGKAEGGFWEINTASHIDWPQQSRVLDIIDNRDGSLSIVSTIIDHAAAPDPGGAPAPRDGQGQTRAAVSRLAAISRELSFNDPHSANGEDGWPDARGGEDDRNVELVVKDPRAP